MVGGFAHHAPQVSLSLGLVITKIAEEGTLGGLYTHKYQREGSESALRSKIKAPSL